MDRDDTKKRMLAAYALLQEETTTQEKFESIRTFIKGIHPRIDTLLEQTSQAISAYVKFHNNEIIELSAELLPEDTEEKKKRKRALLLLIRNWKSLKSEVNRVKTEFDRSENHTGKPHGSRGWGRIIAGAKGPLGMVTIAAIIIVGSFVLFTKNNKTQSHSVIVTKAPVEKHTTQVVEFQGKQIPLTELAVRNGPDCDSPHYHALNHVKVVALDGTVIFDPGACAFGKTKDVHVLTISR